MPPSTACERLIRLLRALLLDSDVLMRVLGGSPCLALSSRCDGLRAPLRAAAGYDQSSRRANGNFSCDWTRAGFGTSDMDALGGETHCLRRPYASSSKVLGAATWCSLQATSPPRARQRSLFKVGETRVIRDAWIRRRQGFGRDVRPRASSDFASMSAACALTFSAFSALLYTAFMQLRPLHASTGVTAPPPCRPAIRGRLGRLLHAARDNPVPAAHSDVASGRGASCRPP
ncbi:hypothetical protein B0H15DRAFT_946146 [Mycena belliarum]|uniref:Uncharacterized protein n=1 Tax=Mycena belliarum TaxID=1033014 RepID=A0AAD6UFC7_9AGAR|nr:hypothetical protein B0H15DRAFT_946146 [Mycena belliae]